VERIAEKSLREGRGNEISLVLEHSLHCDAVEVVLMGTCPSPLFSQMTAITIQLYRNPRRQSHLQSLVVQFPREGNVQPF
jgi:hypothetical protein